VEPPLSIPPEVVLDGLLTRRLIDRLPAMVAYWDNRCRNVVANAAYVEWFGFTPDDMRGMHIRDVLGEAVYAQNLGHIEAVLAGEDQLFERTLVDTSGAVRHTQASYVPDVVNGSVAGFFVLVTDVTSRVLAERAVARALTQYRALARSIPRSFVVVFDRDLRFLVADGPALATFGLTQQDMEQHMLWDVLPERAAELEPRYRSALEGATSAWDRVVGNRTIALTAGPLRGEDGRVFAGMVVGTDVTSERRREATSRGLQRLSKAAARGASPEEVVDLVATTAVEVFGADFGGVVRFDDNGRAYALAVAPALPSVISGRTDLAADESTATAQVARTGIPSMVQYDASATGVAALLHGTGVRVGVATPVLVHGRLWGAVTLGFGDEPVGDHVLRELTEFAELIAISIANAHAWEALERLATIDPLTGLANRRAFDDHLAAALAAATRTGSTISIAILDLDEFKLVNDTHGHVVGDRVLGAVGALIAREADGFDIVARIGGEEFALVSSNDDVRSTHLAVERLREAIAAAPFLGIRVTASIGVHTARGPDLDSTALLEQADGALYRAKASGRNATEVDRPDDG